jgi:endo-1,4-beta-xylanase
MKTKGFFVFGLPVVLLALGLVLGRCSTDGGADDDDGNDTTFVAVTAITGVPTAALKDIGLTLSGTVVPPSATNKTIVWNGSGVHNGVLTAASVGSYTVTATIANGKSKSSSYTQTFNITVYDAGNSTENLFGSDGTPFIWGMDNTGGTVYATLNDTTWVATAEGATYNNGTYSRISNTKAAQWTVTGGDEIGNTGLAIITGDGTTMLVANFTSAYSDMNGTFTKLNTSLSLEGTWISNQLMDGYYTKIAADGSGNITQSSSSDNSNWTEVTKGTYVQNTNPATYTITQVNTALFTNGNDSWVNWDALDQQYKNNVNFGSQTGTVIIYSNKLEGAGYTFLKQ